MNENAPKFIYHIAIKNAFISDCDKFNYKPADFEKDGFIHCTAEPETTLLVLEDYFQNVDDEILIIKIEVHKVKSQVKFENPAPIAGGGTNHLKPGLQFPHIYGVLNLDAACGAAIVKKKSGVFVWPEKFHPLDSFLVL